MLRHRFGKFLLCRVGRAIIHAHNLETDPRQLLMDLVDHGVHITLFIEERDQDGEGGALGHRSGVEAGALAVQSHLPAEAARWRRAVSA